MASSTSLSAVFQRTFIPGRPLRAVMHHVHTVLCMVSNVSQHMYDGIIRIALRGVTTFRHTYMDSVGRSRDIERIPTRRTASEDIHTSSHIV